MIKKLIKNTFNILLSPFDVRIVKKNEIIPNPSALRERLFKQLILKGFYPKHILDVGAHEAEWSTDALKIFPESIFTLIEPQIEMKPKLDEFCLKAKKAKWILAGAGATDGELLFTLAPNSDSSSFAIQEDKAAEWGTERRVLPLVTLDSVCERNSLPIPEIVKIDAEGLDLDVVKGAKKLIGKTEIFFIEIPFFDYWPNQSFYSIIQYMNECGYVPYDITDINRRKNDEALALMEMAFVRKNGMLRNYHGW